MYKEQKQRRTVNFTVKSRESMKNTKFYRPTLRSLRKQATRGRYFVSHTRTRAHVRVYRYGFGVRGRKKISVLFT